MKYAIAIAGLVLFLGAPTQAKPPPECLVYCPLAVTTLKCPPVHCPVRHCLLAQNRCLRRVLKHLLRECRKDHSVCPPPTTTTTLPASAAGAFIEA
jgi:hypothetical protein